MPVVAGCKTRLSRLQARDQFFSTLSSKKNNLWRYHKFKGVPMCSTNSQRQAMASSSGLLHSRTTTCWTQALRILLQQWSRDCSQTSHFCSKTILSDLLFISCPKWAFYHLLQCSLARSVMLKRTAPSISSWKMCLPNSQGRRYLRGCQTMRVYELYPVATMGCTLLRDLGHLTMRKHGLYTNYACFCCKCSG